jgi:hypothetical protein
VVFVVLPLAGVTSLVLSVAVVTALALPVYTLRIIPTVRLERGLQYGRSWHFGWTSDLSAVRSMLGFSVHASLLAPVVRSWLVGDGQLGRMGRLGAGS